MKTTITKEIDLPEAPKGYIWMRTGVYQDGSPNRFNANYELIRTHREDGTPLEIQPLPEMPDNVERVEYFGTGMKPDDMGDADAFIYKFIDMKEWVIINKIENSIKITPSGSGGHYARVWYKKEKTAPTGQKTRLQDLIGEDYQGRAYIVMTNDYWINFHPAKCDNSLGFEDARYGLNQNTRWSNSPFTSFKDANPFVF